MFFHPKNLKSENNNPSYKPRFNILLHTQSIVCATVDSQCLECLGYITLVLVLLLLWLLLKVSNKYTVWNKQIEQKFPSKSINIKPKIRINAHGWDKSGNILDNMFSYL